MILGLDVSTSTTGYCILNNQGDLIDIGYIKLGSKKSLSQKGFLFKEQIENIIGDREITAVYIEEAFQRYGRGMSSAKTITRLASFNGIIQYITADIFGCEAILLPVRECRKLCGIATVSKKKSGKEVKEQVFEWVDNHLEYKWPTKVLQSGPRRGTQIIVPESRDMADAWVVAKAGFIKYEFNV